MIGILKTNDGPHSVADWAEATASHIVAIADSVAGEKRGAAIKLQAAVIDILEGHHAAVQIGERAKIASDGHDRLQAQVDPEHHLSVADAVKQIVAAAQGTPWESDFNFDGAPAVTDGEHQTHAVPSMADQLTVLLSQHFKTSMMIERSWHADRNPSTDQAKLFRSNHNVGA